MATLLTVYATAAAVVSLYALRLAIEHFKLTQRLEQLEATSGRQQAMDKTYSKVA